jgi:hypothetical protein
MSIDDLKISSYNQHYELLRHYSSLLFKGRVSVVTVCVLIWAYILGIVKDLGTARFSFLGLNLESKSNVALGVMFLLLSFMSLETAYARRFIEVVTSGRLVEKELGSEAFFSRYAPPTWSPMVEFYAFNELGLAAVFVSNMWSLNGGSVGVTAVCLSLVPFLWIIRSYHQHSKWVKTLLQTEVRPGSDTSRPLKGVLKGRPTESKTIAHNKGPQADG